ncbi:unnamed protein product [Adineta steineri]|uniref:Uncharacterized protein n=1 Tax=Adineta steineri TaxID=433720 RepID=A0A819PTX8_9BILA|nr:unnamed protein product [Adineta steineri]CAF4018589.1 unnamed protein product [Adineta steineri]
MFIWGFIVLIGYFSLNIVYCQDNAALTEPGPRQNLVETVTATIDVIDNPSPIAINATNTLVEKQEVVTEAIPTTTPVPEVFSCYECTNCSLKSNLPTINCGEGINQCYKIEQRIGNSSLMIHRGCSTTKDQCIAPMSDQSNLVESTTCCPTPKCNQATQFLPLLFLSTLSLFTILINILNI